MWNKRNIIILCVFVIFDAMFHSLSIYKRFLLADDDDENNMLPAESREKKIYIRSEFIRKCLPSLARLQYYF